MNDDQFSKLFRYMQQEFGNVHAEIADLRGMFDRLQTTVDGIVKDREVDHDERCVVSSRLDRHEDWIE